MSRPDPLRNSLADEPHLLIEAIEGWKSFGCIERTKQIVSPQVRTTWPGGLHVWDGRCRCEASHDERHQREIAEMMLLLNWDIMIPGSGMPWHLQLLLRRRTKRHGHRAAWNALPGVWAQQLRRHHANLMNRIIAPPGVDEAIAEAMADLAKCRCGVNAFATSEQLMASEYADEPIIARVKMSGHVRQFETGWRAEQAQVVELWAVTNGRPARRLGDHCQLVREIAQAQGLRYAGSVHRPRPGRSDAFWRPETA